MGKGFNFPLSRLWPPHRRGRIESVAAEAEALMRDLGAAAYSEARRREHEASSEAVARDWRRVAVAVARRFGSQIGPGASSRTAGAPEGGEASPRRIRPPRTKVDALKPVLEARPQWFRIQYVGAPVDHRPSILKEVEIQVLDVSSAIVEAANLPWPPRTMGLRILDRDGCEVFERHKADLR